MSREAPVDRLVKLKFVSIGAALLLVVAGALWLLRPWLVAPALPEGILEGHGRIEGTEVTVSSQVTGSIATFPIAEGDALKQGTLIAAITAEDLEPRLAQASARAAAADAQVKMREEETQAQLAEANARLEAAQERLLQARARIEVLEHHAEKAGTVLAASQADVTGARAVRVRSPPRSPPLPHATRDQAAAAGAAREEVR